MSSATSQQSDEQMTKTFPDYHQHAAAELSRIYDQQGETAMLRAAEERGRPLDEMTYIFPDDSILQQGYGYYGFWSEDEWNATSVKRPAQRGFYNGHPFPTKRTYPDVAEPQPLAAYALLTLYREFSNNCYSAGWMGEPENDKRLQQEFTEWLQERIEHNRHLGPNTPRRFTNSDQSALSTLAQLWEQATDQRK